MEKELKKVLQKIKYEPSQNLSNHIFQNILKISERRAKVRFWIFSFVSAISFIGLISTFFLLSQDFARSGFYQYFSLIFSNSGAVALYWKEFLLTLADSLPIMSFTMSLVLLFVFILSMRSSLQYFFKSRLSVAL